VISYSVDIVITYDASNIFEGSCIKRYKKSKKKIKNKESKRWNKMQT